MLEDETVTNYVRWSKSGSVDALCIPDIEAFVVNAMPKHFKEMKQVLIAIARRKLRGNVNLSLYGSGAASKNNCIIIDLRSKTGWGLSALVPFT